MSTDVIPFDEIVPGATVRVAVINGIHWQYLSVRDVIMCLCDATMDYAGQIWRNLADEHKSEVRDSHELPFPSLPGRGQSEQPVITFPGAVKLSMFLPGENAKRSRSAMAQILWLIKNLPRKRQLFSDMLHYLPTHCLYSLGPCHAWILVNSSEIWRDCTV